MYMEKKNVPSKMMQILQADFKFTKHGAISLSFQVYLNLCTIKRPYLNFERFSINTEIRST